MVLKNIRLAVVLIFCLFSAVKAFAQDGSGATAREVVEKFQTELIAVMKNGKQLGFAGRYDKLYGPVSNSHALTRNARVVVGSEWEKLSEAQQQKMIEVFSRFSVASYAHFFNDYSGESFVFQTEKITKIRGIYVITYNLVIPDKKPVQFDYALTKKGNSWIIFNIAATGVSDLAIRTGEFTAILQREGFDALIVHINELIDNYSKP